MIALMIVIFVVGYLLITLEHPLKINKAAIALLIGTLLWIIYMYAAPQIIPGYNGDEFQHFLDNSHSLSNKPFIEQVREFVISSQIIDSLGNISQTLLFLLGAMTIVEIIDVHGGFSFITDKITTRHKRRLLWMLTFITFFMSAVLDNLTTTIIMIMLLRKLVPDKHEQWIYGSIIVIAANSGGAWSPIGDVTTIMLWVGGNISANVIPHLFLPSLVSIVIPAILIQHALKGTIDDKDIPKIGENPALFNYINIKERVIILIFGLAILILTPVFKTITHLPPFMGVWFGVSLFWLYTDVMYNKKNGMPELHKANLHSILKRLDYATLLFFLGILLAVDALGAAGILNTMADYMVEHMPNVYAQGISIGLLSAIVDNVPLVAAAMGMYPVADASMIATAANPELLQYFVADGVFWHFLAYCAGTGGSILIIGSAAGVVFMGMEKVPFEWYLKHISWIALIGYLAGAGVYILQNMLFM
ncbi:MAG: sodium:proton antiporter NhaD [Dysgonamonadaceae bacterium]